MVYPSVHSNNYSNARNRFLVTSDTIFNRIVLEGYLELFKILETCHRVHNFPNARIKMKRFREN